MDAEVIRAVLFWIITAAVLAMVGVGSWSVTFFDEQRRFIAASGLLMRDLDGAVILVKPHYKDTWQLPGGFAEPDESPRLAAEREVLEELGVQVSCGRLICVDFKSANDTRPACLQFVFDGGIVPAETISRFSPADDELEQWAAVPVADAPEWAEKGGPASRLRHALDALQSGATVYLEDGRLTTAQGDL